MKSSRGISNNDTYYEIYQKVADMVSSNELSSHVFVSKTSKDAYQRTERNTTSELLSPQLLLSIFGQRDFAVTVHKRFSFHVEAVK